MNLLYPKVHVIINPAAGQDEPILNVLNDIFRPAGIEWDVSLTHKSGDATRQAAKAAAEGVNAVAVYGGDGTQMEAANGLVGTGVPQVILPGGTGNAMAHDLQVPLKLRDAAALLTGQSRRRPVDLVRCNETIFMLRAYTGISSDLSASREEKDKLGQLAYVQNVLKFVRKSKPTHFKTTVDGKVYESEALVVFVLNAGTIGEVMGINIPTVGDVSVSDGFVDLYVVTEGVHSLGNIPKLLLKRDEIRRGEIDEDLGVFHARAQEIILEATPPQDMWLDGEQVGTTPVTMRVLPKALEVVVP